MTGWRALLLIVAAVTVWYACTLVLWAVRPLSDAVPIGVDYTLPSPRPVTSTVECNTLFDSAARDESAPLPTFAAQPGTAPPLAFQRAVCTSVHRQARTLFSIDTAAVAVLWIAALWVWNRGRRTRAVRAPRALA